MLNSFLQSLSEPIAGTGIVGWHFVILAIALLPFVLAITFFRERWKRTPDVWRCILISAMAHILLGIFAFATNYVVVSRVGETDNDVAVQVLALKDEGDSASEQSEPTVMPWDQFTNHIAQPDVEPLERPREEPEVIIDRVWDEFPNKKSPLAPLVAPPLNALPSTNLDATQLEFAPSKLEDELELLDEANSIPTPIEAQENSEGATTRSTEIEVENSFSNTPPNEIEIPMDLQSTKQSQSVLQSDWTLPPLNFNQKELPKGAVPAKLASFDRNPSASNGESTPRRLGDSQPMPKIYSKRQANERLKSVQSFGGSAGTEEAVAIALSFMAANQSPEGNWSSRMTGGGIERKVLGQDRKGAGSRADCGITGLATLAFLSAGNTQFEGEYKDVVGRALQYLSDHQAADGCMAGDAQAFERTYCHSMAMLAASEALAVTGDARLLPIVRRAVDYSIRSQNKTDGGWRYQPGDAGDMSQFGWQVLALHSASLGGIPIPESTLIGMNKFLTASTRGSFGGLGCYRPGDTYSATMTAEALASRFLLVERVKPETIEEAVSILKQSPPSLQEVNYYYWYYATMAMHHAGGEYWNEWNEQLKPVLLAHQIRSGADAGCWPADDPWSGYGGKIYSTAMATLCLEAYYRYVSINELRKSP